MEVNTTEPTIDTVKRSDPTLRDLLAPLFRRKRMVILTFCGVLLGSGLAAFLLSAQHEASMEILVHQERVEPPLTPESTQVAASAATMSDTQVNSEVELLKSPDLLQQVVLATHLQDDERKGFLSSLIDGKQNDDWYVARAVDHLSSKLKIKVVTKTSMIQVTYSSLNPRRAYNVLRILADRYLEKHLAVHRPQGSYVFFTSEAEKYGQALQQSEARLADFSKKSGDAAPDLQKAAMAQQVVSSVATLHETKVKVAAEKQ